MNGGPQPTVYIYQTLTDDPTLETDKPTPKRTHSRGPTMTSDKFSMVLVDRITFRNRQRKDVGDIDPLGGSIDNLELIEPIVITRWTENGLHIGVCGERRYRAHIARGRKEIACLFTDEVDPIKLMEMEFAENVHRLDTTWEEKCDAVRDYHKARLERHGKWSQKETARALSVSPALVCKYLGISDLAPTHPELKKQKDLSTAWTKAKKINASLKDVEDEEMSDLIDELFGRTKTERPKAPIITDDFCKWVKTYSGERFNFLHCDFPYGINTDQRQQGNIIDVQGGYDDSPETYWTLLKALCDRDNLNRICADSAHIMLWFSMNHYHGTLKFFAENSDFEINPFPLIWVKSNGVGLLPDPMRGPRRVYETCLFGSRGDRKITKVVQNACYKPTDKSEDHPTAKPYDMLCEFFPMFIDGNTKMLDPTCGSGTALRAAKSLGAEYVLGIEKDPTFAEPAAKAFDDWVQTNGNGQSPTPMPV
jgi:ParB/RepB/Spo0J family partition protein